MNDPAEDSMSFDDARTRVMHMVSELCRDEQCAMFASLGRCVTEAVSTHWSNPVKTFVPLFAYREVRKCIEQGYCPTEPAGAPG